MKLKYFLDLMNIPSLVEDENSDIKLVVTLYGRQAFDSFTFDWNQITNGFDEWVLKFENFKKWALEFYTDTAIVDSWEIEWGKDTVYLNLFLGRNY